MQVDVILNDSAFKSGVQRMVRDLKNVESSSKGVEKASNGMASGFKGAIGAMAGIGAAVGGIELVKTAIGGVVKVGMDYTKQMSKVEALSKSTSLQMAELGANARKLGSETVWSATNVAEAYEYMALAGWDSNQMIAASEPLLNLATAGALDLAKASDIVTDTMTPFGMAAEEAGKAADIFAVAQSSANLNVEQMGETMKYAAPVANAFGMNLEETSAIAMIFANSGIKASMAGTALRAGLSRLASPPKAAAKALDQLGVSTVKADGNMKSMHDIISEMSPKFLELSESQQIASAKAIFGEEAYAGWMEVLKGGVEQFDNFTEKLYTSDGAAKVAADTMSNNLTGAMDNLSSQTEDLGLVLFSTLEPALVGAANGTTSFVGAIDKMIDPSGRAVEAAKLMQKEDQKLAQTKAILENRVKFWGMSQNDATKALKEAEEQSKKNLTVEGMMAQKKVELEEKVKSGKMSQEQANKILEQSQVEYEKLGQGIEQTRQRQEFFNKAFEPLRNGIGIVKEMGVAIGDLWKAAQGDASAGVKGVSILTKLGISTESIKVINDVVSSVSQGVGALKAIVMGDWGTASNLLDKLGFSPEQQASIQMFIQDIKAQFSAFVQNIQDLLSNAAPVITGIFGETFKFVGDLFNKILPVVMPILNDAMQFINDIIKQISDFWKENGEQILQAVHNVFEGIKAVIEFVMPLVKFIIEDAWNAIKDIVQGAVDIIMGIIKFFASVLTGDFSGMWEGIKQIFQGAVELIWGLINLSFIKKIGSAIKSFGSLLKSFFADMWGAIKALWEASIETIKKGAEKGFKSLMSAIKAVVSTLKDIVKEGWDKAIDFLKGINLEDIGKKIIKTLIDGIKSMFGAVGSAMGSISDKIQGAFSGRSIQVEGKVSDERTRSARPMLRGLSPVRAVFAMDSPMPMVAAPALGEKGGLPSNNFRSAQSPLNMALSQTLAPLASLNRDLSSSLNKSSRNTSVNHSAIQQQKQSPIQLEIPVTIDGKEVARATAIYTNNELAVQNRRFNLAKGVRI
ncbi:phage tail tape measure protein [Bacillus pseudomycoides]|nr:phage tail tape measure protein [Bacillus pseudomycoides]